MNEKDQHLKFPCPCCGYHTLSEKAGGTHNICEVCYWEDDATQLSDPDTADGANGVSLREGQKNYQECGACERDMTRNVRKPRPEESRSSDWKFLE